jgi:hypothetical protein
VPKVTWDVLTLPPLVTYAAMGRDIWTVPIDGITEMFFVSIVVTYGIPPVVVRN